MPYISETIRPIIFVPVVCRIHCYTQNMYSKICKLKKRKKTLAGE